MPYAYNREDQPRERKYCIATTADNAVDGRGSLCSELPKEMKDLKLITSYHAITREVKFKQITQP